MTFSWEIDMRNAVVGFLLVGAVAVGWGARVVLETRGPIAAIPTDGVRQLPTDGDSARPLQRWDDDMKELKRDVRSIQERIANLQGEMETVTAWIDSLPQPNTPLTANPGESSMPPQNATPEKVKQAWEQFIAQIEKNLLVSDPAGRGSEDGMTRLRFQYIDEAKAALREAKDMRDLEALTKGKFRSTFQFQR